MLEYARKLHDELISKLKELEEKLDQKTISPDYRLDLITGTLDQLKEKIGSHPFSNDHEEILFFKSIMPLFLALLIYYNERLDLESVELIGTLKAMEDYYERVSERINRFFTENTEYFKYYRTGRTNFDACYFLRKSPLNQENMFLPGYTADTSSCTIFSIKSATILAYARLEKDMRMKLAGEGEKVESGIEEYKLEWTASKTDLTELIHGLMALTCFNHGKSSLTRVVRSFEKMFCIDLGNPSKTFQEILRRKTGTTSFIDRLRDSLNAKIDAIEEENRRRNNRGKG